MSMYVGPGGYSGSTPKFAGPNSGARQFRDRDSKDDEHDWSGWEEEEKAAPVAIHNPKDDWPFYCEPCDKGFYNKKRYDDHCDEHIHCPVPGCNFLCRKEYKLELHQVLLHDRNNVNLQDTAKYLAERKRRYPTMARVEEAKQIAILRQQRGEALGRNSARGQGAQQGGGKKGGGKAGGKGAKSRPPLYYKCRSCGRPGHYTEHCWNEEGSSKWQLKRSRSPEQDDGEPEEKSAREPPPGVTPKQDDAGNSILETENKVMPPPPAPTAMSEAASRIHHASFQQRRPRRRKPTLWEKLIQTDVQREKSMMLQCLRYFVLTDFLRNDLDWVAFVAHSTRQDLASYSENRNCAVRAVTNAPDTLQTLKRIKLDDDVSCDDNPSDEVSSSSSSSEDPQSDNNTTDGINDELKYAKERIRMLEEQLLRQHQNQQPILQDEDDNSV